jgi:thymidylate synthase (FAD)
MVEFKFHLRVPMDCWRQWIRHRTANVNEYSTRYSEAIDSADTTTVWRLQATNNKQGSSGILEAWPDGWECDPDKRTITGPGTQAKWSVRYKDEMPLSPAQYLTEREAEFLGSARRLYEERLSMGIAREQARKDLPLSTYTEAYWKIDLHNLFHFLRLRLDKHAQKEIREYGEAMYKLIQPIVPIACEAFKDYRLDAMTLSGPEIEVISAPITDEPFQHRLGKGEVQEFNDKMKQLGLRVRAV